ncbi:MAG: GNAT family N-acetyltransferase [Pseudomonadota bacterium]
MTERDLFHQQVTTEMDIPALREIVAQTELFPAEVLPDLLTPFLEGQEGQLWLTALAGTRPLGFCFAEAEPMTAGTWNLRAIAVSPSRQGQGVGSLLITGLEERLRELGGRILLIDTSSAAAFAGARAVYLHLGFQVEARIRDFWAEGDDKITHWKRLTRLQ